MLMNPPEGIVGPVVAFRARSLVPFCRKWQPGQLRIRRSPVALRLALADDLPLTPRSGYPRYRHPPRASLPPTKLTWGDDPTHDRDRALAGGPDGADRHRRPARSGHAPRLWNTRRARPSAHGTADGPGRLRRVRGALDGRDEAQDDRGRDRRPRRVDRGRLAARQRR